MVCRVGDVESSYVHIEVFSDIPGGLSVSFCVIGEYGNLGGDFECFTTKFVESERWSFLVWKVDGVSASSVFVEMFQEICCFLFV